MKGRGECKTLESPSQHCLLSETSWGLDLLVPEEQHSSHTARHLCSLVLGHPVPDTTPSQQSNTALAKSNSSTLYFLFFSSLFDLISTHRKTPPLPGHGQGVQEHTTAGTAIHVVLIGFLREIPQVFPVKEADLPCGLQTRKAYLLDWPWHSKSHEAKGTVSWGLMLYSKWFIKLIRKE